MEYHWAYGIFFERQDDGAVRIFKKSFPSEKRRDIALIPENEWCSIVAAMTKIGETGFTFDMAKKLHDIELTPSKIRDIS